MTKHKTPAGGPGGDDLACQFSQFVEPRREGFILIRDKRPAQFEENEFCHGLTVA